MSHISLIIIVIVDIMSLFNYLCNYVVIYCVSLTIIEYCVRTFCSITQGLLKWITTEFFFIIQYSKVLNW